MKTPITLVRSCFNNESGSVAIEYGLISALIAVSLIAGLSAISLGMNKNFNTLSNAVTIK